jgi:hypothetical protein
MVEPNSTRVARLPLLLCRARASAVFHIVRSELIAAFAPHFDVTAIDLADELTSDHQAPINVFRELNPAVIVIEQFPFGGFQFVDSVRPLLDVAAVAATTRLIACSVVQAAVDGTRVEPGIVHNDDEILQLVDRYFDVVFVHEDACTWRLEDTVRARAPFRVPFLYADADETARVVARLTTASAAFARDLADAEPA